VTNGNISGDIVIDADRRVSVLSGDGHGGFTKIFASIGHTTDLISVILQMKLVVLSLTF